MKEYIKLPFKSAAGALLFCITLGPIGLLYASSLGGAVMLFAALVVIVSKFRAAIVLVWLICCIWSVIAVNRYNQKLLNQLFS